MSSVNESEKKTDFFEKFDEEGGSKRKLKNWNLKLVAIIAITWSLFQLWYASPLPFILDFGKIIDVPARSLHLAFGLTLCFLAYPSFKSKRGEPIPIYDYFFAAIGLIATLYIFFSYESWVHRQGILAHLEIFNFKIPYEVILGSLGIILLLEATRRAIGIPLVTIALIFLLFSIFGQSMPDLISHQGLSITRLVGYHWFGGEAIFGIPISVSVSFIFLFVLFGAILDAAGGGKYFLNLAFALVGKMRGGPAKAAILASGLTGLISGSSVANTVTTGTFTIPIMKKTGLPAVKAGAIEVAASVNGQIMPPIMGAAAFVMAELLGISYFTVITHAILPAIICYVALFYISHLESVKLNIKGLPDDQIPPLGKTFLSGIHYLIPIFILIYLLLIERWTAASSVFYSILSLMVIIIVREILSAKKNNLGPIDGLKLGINEIIAGLEKGAINMITVSIAIATAGIIVGAVSSTGLSNNLIVVVEAIAGDNIVILLALTAFLCIVLGMGLPTTANYLVVAALMSHVVVEVAGASGYAFPLIAVHLYVFYFGLMADVTPPVGLASYAASAISKADPIRTGIQAFWYELRTAILPVVFIFNNELLLIGIENIWHGLMVLVTSLLAILIFSSATQGWFVNKLRWYEIIIFIIISLSLFRPGYILDKFYPEYEYSQLQLNNLKSINLKTDRDVHIKVTRRTEYGDRYKLFIIKKDTFNENYSLKDYGINVVDQEGRMTIDTLKWNSLAKKSGIETGDVISEFKIENLDRPNKAIIYPFSLVTFLFFGYLNYRRKKI
ncbi:MAG: TRAP transporter fused permease subunit [Pelagibacteraceae bacterium]|nr:TRAP transporter fused permease subunit [Pelagibacteraceae bacterium]MBO6484663.1 TRAP transporter fused permease subunit [Pelagibacteraceae bacterium]MBO6485568.1 TRAP transporter fused permease subunit [Pelagibacteraceae bacterium]MBO6487424.1 TRAP transporter fused permease subunit [Pelagibacteraceae bacterium]